MNNLRIICLNIWGGRLHKQLLDFIRQNQTIDIFCLQEVFNTDKPLFRPAIKDSVNHIFADLVASLPYHTGYFCAEQDDEEGIAMFIRASLPVLKTGQTFVHRWKNAMDLDRGENGSMLGRPLQYVQIEFNSRAVTVAHVHGLWDPNGKSDTDARLAQSDRIVGFLHQVAGDCILMGDLNLLPDTRSIAILEGSLRNLIKEYGITNTRSQFHTKPEKYADYAMVSSNVTVRDFKVLPDMVSDHAPLYLEVE